MIKLTLVVPTILLLSGCILGSTSGDIKILKTVSNQKIPSTPTIMPDISASPISAPDADVTFVRATQNNASTWTFEVTILHPDTGWEDYADGWDILLENGDLVKPDEDSPFTRLLLHPHVDEHPFTRSQSGITIPADNRYLTVRAHDSIAGFGGKEIILDLTKEFGTNFVIRREGQ